MRMQENFLLRDQWIKKQRERNIERVKPTGIMQDSLLLSNSRHNVSHDRLYPVGRQGETTAVSNDADGFARTVHNDLARLAFTDVFFEFGPQFGTEGVLQVIAELCQKISACEHQGSCCPRVIKWGARLSRSIKRPRSNRAFRAGMLRSNALAASSVESCSMSRSSTTILYFSGRRNTAALTSSSRCDAANNRSGFSAQL